MKTLVAECMGWSRRKTASSFITFVRTKQYSKNWLEQKVFVTNIS